jgi:hypothetical protein
MGFRNPSFGDLGCDLESADKPMDGFSELFLRAHDIAAKETGAEDGFVQDRRVPKLIAQLDSARPRCVAVDYEGWTSVDPLIDFRTDRNHSAAFLPAWPADRQAQVGFPALHGSDTTLEITSYFLPRVQNFVRDGHQFSALHKTPAYANLGAFLSVLKKFYLSFAGGKSKKTKPPPRQHATFLRKLLDDSYDMACRPLLSI